MWPNHFFYNKNLKVLNFFPLHYFLKLSKNFYFSKKKKTYVKDNPSNSSFKKKCFFYSDYMNYGPIVGRYLVFGNLYQILKWLDACYFF